MTDDDIQKLYVVGCNKSHVHGLRAVFNAGLAERPVIQHLPVVIQPMPPLPKAKKVVRKAVKK